MSTKSASPEPNYFDVDRDKGTAAYIKSWLTTVDHKRIGVMYLCCIIVAFLLGGVFALGVRAELFSTGQQLVDRHTFNQWFTLHGAIMVFLVIIPGIPAALGNFALPIQLGAPDVAFPKLNLASFYLWVGGCILLLTSLAAGAVDTGWTFYTPYSTTTDTAVVPAVSGAFLLGFSSIFTGVNFIVTIHKFKPKGMGWFKMPLNLWAVYSTAVIQVLATPVLGITLLLLFVERTLHIGIFDPALGGDPVMFQHFFWFYSHPAVYIMILPGLGVVSEMISTGAHKPIFGYRFIAYSSISLALLSFLVWGHHMFVAGQSKLAIMVFSALTFTVAIPSAIKVFNWIATLFKGDIYLTTPMTFSLAFIMLFGIGGLTGLFLGTLSTDVVLHDTYFVVSHFHYVMMGSTLIAFFGALHYWWPKMWGRMFNDKLHRILAVIIFFAFNLTFLPQFVMGSRGMKRRYFDYDPQFEIWHQLSSIGAFIMGITIFIMFVGLFRSIKHGKKAPDNPWGSTTMEWQAPTPPTQFNFPENEPPPTLYEIYDYSDLEFVSDDEGWVRRSERDGPGPSGAGDEDAQGAKDAAGEGDAKDAKDEEAKAKVAEEGAPAAVVESDESEDYESVVAEGRETAEAEAKAAADEFDDEFEDDPITRSMRTVTSGLIDTLAPPAAEATVRTSEDPPKKKSSDSDDEGDKA